ncbi:MAG: SgcJ/EcaC family oxidoreductase [Chthoniobacteraceae bacterium]
MKITSLVHPTLALMILAATALAQENAAPTDAEKAATAQNDAYVAAFNKGDSKALSAMYAEDAEYSSDAGTVVTGREDIVGNLKKFFSENKGVTLAARVESARFLTPDVLVEKGLATIGDETTRYVCTYVKEGDQWLISDLEETTLPPIDAAASALTI